MRRNVNGSKPKPESKFRYINKKAILILLAVIVAVIVVIAVVSNVATKQKFEASFVETRDTIRIGLRTDIAGFGGIGADGQITGFDKDYIDMLFAELLGEKAKLYEYIPTTSQDAAGSIKYGEIDIAMGLMTPDVDKTKGFLLTKPYYTDDVVVVVKGDSRLDKLSNMDGGKLGILSNAIPIGQLEDYLKSNGMEYEVLRYSDYESAKIDLTNGTVNAMVMPNAIAKQFAGFRILAEPLYQVGYSIMLPTGQAAVESEFSKIVDQFEKDGTTDGLKAKWGL
ncbi:MAG: transporter substrate-binding domain-containing protein [Christensenellaceae bacterium]